MKQLVCVWGGGGGRGKIFSIRSMNTPIHKELMTQIKALAKHNPHRSNIFYKHCLNSVLYTHKSNHQPKPCTHCRIYNTELLTQCTLYNEEKWTLRALLLQIPFTIHTILFPRNITISLIFLVLFTFLKDTNTVHLL